MKRCTFTRLTGIARLGLLSACSAMFASVVLAQANAPALVEDPAALKELTGAALLDVMSEAAVDACEDAGAPSAPQMREAWVAWRGRHQLAALRKVLSGLQRRRSETKPLESVTEPMRKQVLAAAAADPVCAQLMRDLQTPAMDVAVLYPRAVAVAVAVVQAGLASKPQTLPIAPGTPRGELLVPSQMPALAAQHKAGSRTANTGGGGQGAGFIYIKGRVMRWKLNDPNLGYYLAQVQGDRRASKRIDLDFNAEAWVGREVVLRGVPALNTTSPRLKDGALVTDPSALTPSPLPQEPLTRSPVLLQRVLTSSGRGLSPKDLAAIVIHGRGDYSDGSKWVEDVRFLLRDGTYYDRAEMPPDQLDVAASRRLEPQRWGRWRANGKGYEMQAQDDDGRPTGGWQPEKHHAATPWAAGTRLDGTFSRNAFHGSIALGGTSFKSSFRFTRDGRFERINSAFSGSGSMAAQMNGAVITGSSQGSGQGSSSTGGGTVGGAGAFSGRSRDDGASRRGRYEFNGHALTLDYDDGRKERVLSFSVGGDDRVYVDDISYTRNK